MFGVLTELASTEDAESGEVVFCGIMRLSAAIKGCRHNLQLPASLLEQTCSKMGAYGARSGFF